MTKEDLALIDALAAAGCINRSIAKEAAERAMPGHVASYINERGYAIACHGWPTLIAYIAKMEQDVRAMESMQESDESMRYNYHRYAPETD